jgi:hypothetical protein
MKHQLLALVSTVAVVALLSLATAAGQAPTTVAKGIAPASAARTPWGEPDLQGIWTAEYQTPLQRPPAFGNKEFFTDAELAELDRQRAALLRRDYRPPKGSEADVGGAHNAVYESVKRTGRRTSLIVDPPNGRIPPFTAEAQKRRGVVRDFQLALLQATDVCKNNAGACVGGHYGPPSPRRAEQAPDYMTAGMNRGDGPEDRTLGERCLSTQMPDISGFRRIVQSPGLVSISYEGWQRTIPVTSKPHLPSSIRQWWGDSRGHWEGNTLVVDVTNFSPKQEFRGARENLHLIERWTRTGPNTLEYGVTIEDPTTWTRPWTVKQELNKQSDQANRLYYEPRCHEGNYGLVGMLASSRASEKAFAEGRGPDPATMCTAFGGNCGFEGEEDPLEGGAVQGTDFSVEKKK